MKMLKFVAVALFVLAVPLFLISSNVRWVVGTPLLYSYGFAKHNSSQRTGMERTELMSAAQQIRDYFSNSNEYIEVEVIVQGVHVQNLYNEREILHMKDVKGLMRGVYRIQLISGIYLAVWAMLGLALLRQKFLAHIGRILSWGGLLTVGMVGIVGLSALIGFEQLFHVFHLASFSNDYWILDPRRDYLIAMFPTGFFLDGTIWIAGSTILEAVLLVIFWWRFRKGLQEE